MKEISKRYLRECLDNVFERMMREVIRGCCHKKHAPLRLVDIAKRREKRRWSKEEERIALELAKEMIEKTGFI